MIDVFYIGEREKKDRDTSTEKSIVLKEKRSNKEEQKMIRKFMEAQKIKQMMEDEIKKVEAYNDLERKRQDYLNLLAEIEDRRKLNIKTIIKSDSKNRKNSKKNISYSDKKSMGQLQSPDIKIEDLIVGDEDENYSKLYKEYKNIIHQKHKRYSSHGGAGQQQLSHISPTEEDNVSLNIIDFQGKKDELKARFTDLNKRFEQNMLNNHNVLYQNRLITPQTDGQRQFDNSRKKVPELQLRQPARGNREAITEIENSIFFNDNYIQNESLIIPSQPTRKRPINDGSERYYQGGEYPENEEDEEQEEEEESSLGDTTRANLEIIEAAAIFIQKNYRGYRTRKLLRQYFKQLCEEDEAVQQQIYGQQFGRYPENDEDENINMRQRSLTNINYSNYDHRNGEFEQEEGEQEYNDKNPLKLGKKNEFNFLEENQKRNIIELLAL